MNHLLNVLDGFASAFAWGTAQAPSKRTYPATRGGFQRDEEKLLSDIKTVGRDIKKAVRDYGEPVCEGGSEKR